MSIHKLNADVTPKAGQPFDIGVMVNHEEHHFANAILRARIARAMSCAPSSYPIHRLVRCAVRSKLGPLFDEISMHAGVEAHRLEEGWAVLDGPGLFATVWGAWKIGYSSFSAPSAISSNEALSRPVPVENCQLMTNIGSRTRRVPMISISVSSSFWARAGLSAQTRALKDE